MTRWDWKLTGNDSKASQLSRLKDKNQFWIHCDERRVDAGVIVALAPLFHVFNQPKRFSYLNMVMIWCRCRLRWSKRLSLTSLKFWHPAGGAGLLCHHFDRETRGEWDEHLQPCDINTQLSSPTQKNDFLSAIRHINWWVRVLKMVETAYIVCIKFGWDEDNEGELYVGPSLLPFWRT